MWFDTHCHPYFNAYDADREAVLRSAKTAAVTGMLVVGCDHKTNRQTLDFLRDYAGNTDFPEMWMSLGVHPTDCDDWTLEEEKFIREQAQANPKLVAIGEMGLDYHHMTHSKERQAEVFRAQIRLARELDLPCVVHSRNAAEDTLSILLEEKAEKAIFHCYSYGLDFAKKVWEAGYYTSFSGVVTYPQAKDIQEAAKQAPLDRILLETDSPFLPPQSIRGKRNEPAKISETAKKIAELRGIEIGELSKIARTNSQTIFSL